MCEALRRLMKDEIEETLDKATKEASEIALEQGREKGLTEGRAQMQKETSAALSKMGMSVENIASAVNASVEQVLGWI